MRISRAPAGAAAELSALAVRSKAHWGYPAAWLDHWGSQLTVTPAFVESHEVWQAREGETCRGWYALEARADFASLEHFWIEPEAMGRGVGRALFQHARARAAVLGLPRMEIVSDPHAEQFYLRMGATRTGGQPADFERTLPVLEIATRPGEGGAPRELLHVAQTFAQALDNEVYPLARGVIAADCEYAVGEDMHRGPDAIIASYKSSGDWVNATLEGIAYESHLEVLSPRGVGITFVDHIRHGGRAHTHSCVQVISLDDAGFIGRIEHRDIPGEPERVARFLDEVGVDTRE